MPVSLAIADHNDDGAPDVLIPNYNGNAVPILLQSIAPIIQVTPVNLSFTVQQGETTSTPLGVSIANPGGGSVIWSASASQPWLQLSQTSGTAPSSIALAVNPADLTVGTYSATVTITAAGSADSPPTCCHSTDTSSGAAHAVET